MNLPSTNNTPDLSSFFSTSTKWDSFVKRMNLQPWRLFYFGFVPKNIRRNIALKADKEVQEKLAQASSDFIKLYFANGLAKFNLQPKKKLNNDKIIWQYWGQGLNSESLPETVKICFNSVDHYQKDYQIIRLDDNSIRDYLDLPEFIWEKRQNKEFKHVFFSDLLRLALLDAYGGIWMDATILLTESIPENISKMDFFVFQRDKNAQNKAFFEKYDGLYFGWQAHHYVNILSSFMVSKQKGEVVHTWLDLILNFWQTQTTIKHYFFFQIIFNELIHHERFKNANCPVSDDTLVHIMQTRINKKFDSAEFERIKQKTAVHKLRYVNKCVPNSYYDYIRKIYL
nr:capsular polysaccharide synthesis protein [Snodgrassella alvi]